MTVHDFSVVVGIVQEEVV